MTQMQLIEGAAPKRPVADESEDIAVAELLLPRVMEWMNRTGSNGEDDRDGVLAELTDALKWEHDGYQLAADLDDVGWEPDAELVAILNDAAFIRHSVRHKRVRQWVKDWDIKPAVLVGTKVHVRRGFGYVQGEVIATNAEDATYTVFCESLGHVRSGDGTRGMIANFEDVTAV